MAALSDLLELRLRVPLPARVGQVALGALGPDLQPPPQPGGRPQLHPQAQLQCCGDELQARWVSSGARGLRGGVTSFLELLGLVLETIERFGGEGYGQATPTTPPGDPPISCQPSQSKPITPKPSQ